MPESQRRARAQSRRAPQQAASPTREIRRASTDDGPPLFGFHLLVRDYTVADCDQQEKAAFADLVQEMSLRTWRELRLGSRRGTGFEKIDRGSIRVGLPQQLTPDATILAIRVSQRARLIGFRDGAVFYAVWLDPRHEVYAG